MRFAALLLGCLLVAGCVDAPAEPAAAPPVEDSSGPAGDKSSPYRRDMSAEQRAECEAEGGFVERRGMLQSELCVHPYADAGQLCSDNSECEGRCLAESMGTPGEAVTGQCQPDDHLFGCHAFVSDGQATSAICID